MEVIEMKYVVITFKEMQKILKKNGYRLDRQNGDHFVYIKEHHNHISINRKLNPMVARRLVKENGLIIE